MEGSGAEEKKLYAAARLQHALLEDGVDQLDGLVLALGGVLGEEELDNTGESEHCTKIQYLQNVVDVRGNGTKASDSDFGAVSVQDSRHQH